MQVAAKLSERGLMPRIESESKASKKAPKRRSIEVEEGGPGTATATATAPATASPAPKRQRVSRACDNCRASREKCDGIQPQCFPCASQHRHCTWEEPKKKRGVQTGYIRTLELALGWFFDKIPGSEDALHSLLTHEGGQGRSLLIEKDTIAGSRLHRRWQRSTVHREIERVLSTAKVLPMKTDRRSPAGDESDNSGHEVEKRVKMKTDPHAFGLDQVNYSAVAPADGKLRLRIPSTLPVAEPGSKGSNCPKGAKGFNGFSGQPLKLPHNHWHLLDIYFSYTHCWFPVLEKPLVQKTSFLYCSHSQDRGIHMARQHPDAGGHAELWAALALAAYQDRAKKTDGTDGRQSQPSESSVDEMDPEDMYLVARGLIPFEEGPFEARHVNALLLLTLIQVGHQRLTAAWVLVGYASRIALSLGLHLGSTHDGSRRSLHTYMGSFILDTIVSNLVGQPPQLRPDDVQTVVPSSEDDSDEWELWSPCKGFGFQQDHTMASRSPSHSTSSFRTLYGICKVLSHNAGVNRTGGLLQGERYLVEIQSAISDGDWKERRPFSRYILHGGSPTVRLPSCHLLRLVFLCGGVQCRAFSDNLPLMVLSCLQDHVIHFGICGIPPLFSSYMTLVHQRYDLERLAPEQRHRWKQMEEAVHTVWAPQPSYPRWSTGCEAQPRAMSDSRPPPSDQFHTSPIPNAQVNPLLTPTSYFAQINAQQAPSAMDDLFQQNSVPDMLGYVNNQHTAAVNAGLGLRNTEPPQVNPMFVGVDLPDRNPPNHYPSHAPPSFSSAHYETILDDIATNQTDRLESDPQFMANLGFAPGSNLNDVFAHEFMGSTA